MQAFQPALRLEVETFHCLDALAPVTCSELGNSAICTTDKAGTVRVHLDFRIQYIRMCRQPSNPIIFKHFKLDSFLHATHLNHSTSYYAVVHR